MAASQGANPSSRRALVVLLACLLGFVGWLAAEVYRSTQQEIMAGAEARAVARADLLKVIRGYYTNHVVREAKTVLRVDHAHMGPTSPPPVLLRLGTRQRASWSSPGDWRPVAPEPERWQP